MLGVEVRSIVTTLERKVLWSWGGLALLNNWGCYCQVKRESLEKVYMAGTATKPHLIFSIPFGLFAAVGLRFVAWANQDLNLSEVERYKLDQSMKDTLKELGSLEECKVSISKFKRGLWENSLDIAFKACIWICSNREEALKSIWLRPSLRSLPPLLPKERGIKGVRLVKNLKLPLSTSIVL